jgi:hypothetical protein
MQVRVKQREQDRSNSSHQRREGLHHIGESDSSCAGLSEGPNKTKVANPFFGPEAKESVTRSLLLGQHGNCASEGNCTHLFFSSFNLFRTR